MRGTGARERWNVPPCRHPGSSSKGRLLLPAVGVLVLLGILLAGGCSLFGPREAGDDGRAFDMAEARGTVSRFMEARLKGEEEAARGLLTENGRKQFRRSGGLRLSLAAAEPPVTGYRILKESKSARPATFEVRLLESSRDKPHAGLQDESLTVIKEGKGYRIDGGQVSNRFDLFAEDGTLYLVTVTARGDGPQKPVISLSDLPRRFRPQGAAPGTEFGVGREDFGPVAFAPDGKRAAFLTRGTHAFLAVVGLEDQKMKGVDLYFEGAGQAILWSTTGKFLASQVLGPSGFSRVRFYEAGSGTPVDLNLDKRFPPENFALSLVRWLSAGDRFTFRADPGPAPPEEKDSLGLWEADLARPRISRPAATAGR